VASHGRGGAGRWARSTRRCGLALEKSYPRLREMKLRDTRCASSKQRGRPGARTRVLIESSDGKSIWGTVGVSDNIIDASWEALRESVEYMLTMGEVSWERGVSPAGF